MIRFIKTLRILPRWIVVILDMMVIGASTILGYLLRFNFELNELDKWQFERGVITAVLAGLCAVLLTKSYRGIIRYTGLQDGLRIVYTSVIAMVFTFMASWGFLMAFGQQLVPNSVVIITLINSLLFLFYYRLIVKNIFSFYKRSLMKMENVAIFGAGQSGLITKHVIDNDQTLKVVAFLEDDDHKIGKLIDGTRIFDAKDLKELISDLKITQLIISIKELPVQRKNDMVDICLEEHIKVKSVPPVEKWVRGELSLRQIKEVKIEDLLHRDIIKLDKENIRNDIFSKSVFITGAAGSIGSEIVRQVLRFGPRQVVMIDQAESALYELERELVHEDQMIPLKFVIGDVTNYDRMQQLFHEYKPDILYHAAAYKHVPMMEANPSEALNTNVLGSKVIANLCVENRVKKMVFISTDKAVNPTNVMGASKRMSEIYIQSLNNYLQKSGLANTSFVTTRFGNVLGSNGSVIPFFTKQIAAGGPITVTHPEITRFFMTIPEACQLVLEAGAMGNGGEIFIFDMGKAVKVLDLAKKMIQLSGLEPGKDIDIVFTGLREGEKLYEELLNTQENTIATYHNKIMIARVAEYNFETVKDFVEGLQAIISRGDEMEIVSAIKKMIPEYISNFSRFEILDKKEFAKSS